MYSVICKFAIEQEGRIIYNGSLANCIETALNEVMEYIGFCDGYYDQDLFLLNEHPNSTKLKPIFYCIPQLNTFRIYQHKKNEGMFFSEHIYDKVATVKVVRTSELTKVEREPTFFMCQDKWREIMSELKKTDDLLNDIYDLPTEY